MTIQYWFLETAENYAAVLIKFLSYCWGVDEPVFYLLFCGTEQAGVALTIDLHSRGAPFESHPGNRIS
jgi:hypothetical protein